MTSRSRIIGIAQSIAGHSQSTHDIVEGEGYDAHAEPYYSGNRTGETSVEDAIWSEADLNEESHIRRPWGEWTVKSLLIAALLGWTGFFGWAHIDEIRLVPDNLRIISLIGDWAMPVALIALLWILAMRNSRSESRRFARTAQMLRQESISLEERLRTVNEEIATAREFLAQNARELESIGRQSARRLTETSEELGQALSDSNEKARILEEASNAASANLEHLRKHLPVVTSAAKDATNQIGNAGNEAHLQVKSLLAALEQMELSGQTLRSGLDEMTEFASASAQRISGSLEQSTATLKDEMSRAETISEDIQQLLGRGTADIIASIGKATAELDAISSASSDRLGSQLDRLRQDMAATQEQAENTEQFVAEIITKLSRIVDSSAADVDQAQARAAEKMEAMATALAGITASSVDIGTSLSANGEKISALHENAEKLLERLQENSDGLSGKISEMLAEFDRKAEQNLNIFEKIKSRSSEISDENEAISTRIAEIGELVKLEQEAFESLSRAGSQTLLERQTEIGKFLDQLGRTKEIFQEMDALAKGDFASGLQAITEATQKAAGESRQIIETELPAIASRLNEQNEKLLSTAIEKQVETLRSRMEKTVEHGLDMSRATAEHIAQQLAQIDEMTGNLEKRLEDARSGFESVDDESFARRMLLLTEALNSTAIDVAKILSNDVTDTAWSAYLKGDRSVFTRRAVRLLDTGEARIIADHYGEDSEFREHVNRYIHDFESMMRVLLSTRDGNAVGVTLLSSDIGKLYVALAQAIERLRN